MSDNLIGPHNRLFSEMAPKADQTSFAIDNTSLKYFASPYYLLHMKHLQPDPAAPVLTLPVAIGTGDRRRHERDHRET